MVCLAWGLGTNGKAKVLSAHQGTEKRRGALHVRGMHMHIRAHGAANYSQVRQEAVRNQPSMQQLEPA
jgi:hypothetical protein